MIAVAESVFCHVCKAVMYEREGGGIACIKIKCPEYNILKTPENILDDVKIFPTMDADYVRKMMHYVPEAPVVIRVMYILERCKGKRVLNLGSASGELHKAIVAVASSVIGVDKDEPADLLVDLDKMPEAIGSPKVDVIVAGEILEHLANPGNLLKALRHLKCPLVITAPNAAATGLGHFMKKGYENVNPDHVAWYSYHTLKKLLERYQFEIEDFAWYHGKPRLSEGLIITAR